MKLRFFLTAIVALLAFEVHAQQGLNVNALFQGKVVPHEEMVDVRVKGRAISKYKLDFYRSIRFNATEQQRSVVDDLVDSDCKTAMGTEQTTRNGTTTLIMTLPKQGNMNRYLCYLTCRKHLTHRLRSLYP